jgi:mannose-6-phosphate isomerase-like protein (cupin superfamily)
MRVTSSSKLKGGDGTAEIIDILEPDEMYGTGRLFGITRMPPGVSAGQHTHSGDFETYYILEGKAKVNDNGKFYELYPGDMIQCKDGDFHAIESIGDCPLVYLAVIIYSR